MGNPLSFAGWVIRTKASMRRPRRIDMRLLHALEHIGAFVLGGRPSTGNGAQISQDRRWLGAYDHGVGDTTRTDISVALCDV